jgi:hypothetical protein
MMVHAVYFWLKDELTDQQRRTFEEHLNALTKIPHVKHGHVGRPASTEQRDVVDHSFSFALVLEFEDVDAHDAYQEHPIHHRFTYECKTHWRKLMIYDSAA